jgi:pimeloyl-ACP methyl ester carboxylesterase
VAANAGRNGLLLRLPDGRRLGYDDRGPSDGHPILYFHGSPSCRLDLQMFASDDLLERVGVRVIAVDRPGCGLSDFAPRRSIASWTGDASVLADHLGLTRFGVLGWSGGGAYAAACALALSDRVVATGIVSAVAPHDVPGLSEGTNPASMRVFKLCRDKPLLARQLLRLMAYGAKRSPQKFLTRTAEALPPVDAAAINGVSIGQAYVRAVRECLRPGPRGGQTDLALMVCPWGFDPARIVGCVHLWHGDLDVEAPPQMGRWLAAAIPECRAVFLADQGHISLIVDYAETILQTVAMGEGTLEDEAVAGVTTV